MSDASVPTNETLEEKANRLEREIGMLKEKESPTGTPKIPAALVPWLNVVFLASGAAAAFLASQLGAAHWSVLVAGLISAISLALMANSPGLRRAAMFLLLAGAALTSTGCVHVNRPQLSADLSACAAGFMTSEVQAVLPDVAQAIQGRSADWQAQLDGVLLRGGQAAVCALLALVQSLEGGTGGSPGAMPVVLLAPDKGGLPPAVVLLRGYAYLDSRR